MEDSYINDNYSFASFSLDRIYICVNLDKKTKSKKYLYEALELGFRFASIYLVIYLDIKGSQVINKVKIDFKEILEKEDSPNYSLVNMLYGSFLIDLKNKPKAFTYYLEACNTKKTFSCNYISEILQDKERSIAFGQVRNRKLAKYYKNRACMLNPKYCN